MGKKDKKKKAIVNKESIAECWCFVCKDGGELRICDYGQCLKSYHSECLEKDDAFLESEDYWACAWHTCFVCHRASRFKCYTCTNAVCSRCLRSADFLKVKGANGFCNACLKLALLVEENKEYDSDGEKVDFKDRETFEGLFMEYYVIIKEAECFSLDDIYAAQNQNKKKKNHQPDSYLEEFDEEEESDYDDLEPEEKGKKKHKRKRLESAKQTSARSNGKVFIGWASTSLVQFLSSIGKSTTEKLSQEEVTSIVNDYVKENKLYHQERKRMIVCDELLQLLFKRRMINRYRVYDLLEDHFAENHGESEDDVAKCDSDDSSAGVSDTCKRPRKPAPNKTKNKEPEKSRPESCFASVVVENLKLVYLKRTLLHELLEQPQSFDEKVVGCFVRVKSDPHDYSTRNSHLLRQIKGVKNVPGSEKNAGTVFLFSNMPGEVHLSLVSDDDFTEEECEDLKRKMLDGHIERLTVVYLQEKAKLLHKEITKHRICKELAKLRHLIDRANEKGWRYEMFEYLEKKKKLQDPSVQTQMLEDVPKVIPDVSETGSSSGDIIHDTKSAEESPESMVQEAAADAYPTTPAPKPFSTSKVKQNGPDDEQPFMCYRRTRSRKCQVNSKSEVIELCDNENDCPTKTSPVGATVDTDSKIWCIGGENREPDKSSMSTLMNCSDLSSMRGEKMGAL